MSPSPATEIVALASTATAAVAAWIGGKFIALGTIDKDDLVGPVGALMLAVACLFVLAAYFVKRQRLYDTREERREERREEQLVHIASIAEASNRAVETSNEAIKEMRKTVSYFERSVNENTDALKRMENQLRGCPGNNNPKYHERTEK